MSIPQLPPGADVWAIPAAPAPPPLTSNLVDPPSNGNIVIVPLSVFIVIATIFVLLRLYVRYFVQHALGLDDLTIVIALLGNIAQTGVTIWGYSIGMVGRHVWDTPLGFILYDLPKWETAISVLPQPVIFLIKFTILWLYYRLFKPRKATRYAIWIGIIAISIIYTTFFFILIFTNQLGNNVNYVFWAQAIANVVTDLYLLALPIYAVSQLQLRRRKKIGVIAIFLTGAVACIMSIVTLYFRIADTQGPDPDPTWDNTSRVLLIVLEQDIGIMVACMPVLAHFVTKSFSLGSIVATIRTTTRGLLQRITTRSSNGSSAHSRHSRHTATRLPDDNATSVSVHSAHSKPRSEETPIELTPLPSNSSAKRHLGEEVGVFEAGPSQLDARETRREWFERGSSVMDVRVHDQMERNEHVSV